MNYGEYQGAWMTDIDDTLVLSGELPDQHRLDAIANFIDILKKHSILWIPMSGVALVKLGPRILYRLPTDNFSHVLYYGGDGSLKYFFNSTIKVWAEDEGFSSLFSDAQSLIVLGEDEFIKSIMQIHNYSDPNTTEIQERLKNAKGILSSKGYTHSNSILGLLKKKLAVAGHDPKNSETYFRGGSVSWMMLGDVSADPYHIKENLDLRLELIEMSKKWLKDHNNLSDIGGTGINVPFPGARGIKFVLMGNDKERSARDLIRWTGLSPHQLIYAGNELFDGGNDNMLRNIKDVTLLSVGDREDSGSFVVNGRISKDGKKMTGVHANLYWMDWTVKQLEKGIPWAEILTSMREVSA